MSAYEPYLARTPRDAGFLESGLDAALERLCDGPMMV
jgi:hypothetical protein